MSFDLSVALLKATGAVVQDEDSRGEAEQLFLGAGILNALVGLVDILDVPFEHQ